MHTKSILKIVTFYLLILLYPVAIADTKNSECLLQGKVVSVADGDTITVLDDKKKQHKIRLTGIDAPEEGQPFSKKAKNYLSARVRKKTVCINWHKKDRYGRKVGNVFINKEDINFKLVDKGLAWHFKKYQKEQSQSDRKKYSDAETDAKLAVIGLWSEPDPIAPWDWRDGVRPKKGSEQKKRKIIEKKRVAKTPKKGFSCGGKRFCKHMGSCAEARFYLTQCGLSNVN